MKKLFARYFDIQHLSPKESLFDVIVLGSIAAGIISIINTHISKIGAVATILASVTEAIIVLLFFVAHKYKIYDKVSVFICALAVLILFPMNFFYGGGIDSGMPIWFVLGILFTVLLLEGRAFWVTLIMELIVDCIVFAVSYRYPELVIPFKNSATRYVDVMQALFFVGIVLGAILKYQQWIYQRLQEDIEKKNEMLTQSIRKSELAEEEMKEAWDEAEQARIEAEMANRAKDDFLANMSHEMRTPMNAIVGLSEILLRDDLHARERDMIVQIKSAGNTLLEIINETLDFSKIKAGKLKISESEYALTDVIKGVSQLVAIRIKAQEVNFIVETDGTLPRVLYGDALRIRQVLVNLLTNAIKFTKKGYIKLRVYREEQSILEPNRISLGFCVEDTGIGITEKDMEHLFDSFYQVDAKKNREIEGTGLGLAIAKQLAEKMGGNLVVKSTYGHGSEFVFTINQTVIDSSPISQFSEDEQLEVYACFKNEHLKDALRRFFVDEPVVLRFVSRKEIKDIPDNEKCIIFVEYSEYVGSLKKLLSQRSYNRNIVYIPKIMIEPRNQERVIIMRAPFSLLNFAELIKTDSTKLDLIKGYDSFIAPNAKVLVVDDNQMNLNVAVGLLEPLQMQVDTALSGEEAINKAISDRYDIIFMDHMMPRMDGVEATHILRNLESEYLNKVPIIALTANAVNGAKEMLLREGMDDYIAKPFSGAEIASKVKKWLNMDKQLHVDQSTLAEMTEADQSETEVMGIVDLNTVGAIKRVGSAEIYKNALFDFSESYENIRQKITDYAGVNDKLFQMEMHTLKSSAALIGAENLADMAEFLELSETDEYLDERVPELLEEYQNIVEQIVENLSREDEKEKEKQPFDKEAVKELLYEMKEMAADFDMDAVDDNRKAILEFELPEAMQEQMDLLKKSIESFSYKDIAPRVDAMLTIADATVLQ
ncbi:MAG: response regulator [Lachnospiraceae bacterium]|nr:response regulator [Lachnospiraceae bacterium]